MIRRYPHLIITILSALLFIPFLGRVHLFDWDEINFAEAAREMILSHNYSRVQINFEPFWEKPPLFFWMQVACMKLFGINEFAARLPNALCGILTLNFIFYYGKKWYSTQQAWWWILLYIGSFTPNFYFKSGIIDPVFNLFIFLAIVQLYLAANGEKGNLRHFISAGLLLGLALLTKGPVAVLIVGLCGLVYLIFNKFKLFFNLYQLLALFAAMLFIPLLWLVPDWISNGFWFTSEFLKYQVDLFLHPVASHGQPWYYHPLVLLFGCFPAVIIGLPYLFRNPPVAAGGLVSWLKILFWVVLILFSMVTTKIVHYSSLCYLPVTFLGAWGLYQFKGELRNWQKGLLILVGLVYTLVFTLIPLLAFNKTIQSEVLAVIRDDFAKANLLVETNWTSYEWIIGIIFLFLMFTSSLIYLKKSKVVGLRLFLIGNTFYLFMVSALLIPKIENHVQGSIIRFYEQLQGKNIYIETVGFKSYAHYFYTRKPLPSKRERLYRETMKFYKNQGIDTLGQLNEVQRNQVNAFKKEWFLSGNIDKTVYLVYKITNTETIESNPDFTLVFNKGGYKVFKREAFIESWLFK